MEERLYRRAVAASNNSTAAGSSSKATTRMKTRMVWTPLPQGWEIGAALPGASSGTLQVPPEVLKHRAVLLLPDGIPFSEVVETYTSNILAFPEPPRH
jgi:hypothetical protein